MFEPLPRKLQKMADEGFDGSAMVSPNGTKDGLRIVCGPLLNYKGMGDSGSGMSLWRGSVLIVTKGGHWQPQLRLQYYGPWAQSTSSDPGSGDNLDARTNKATMFSYDRDIPGVRLYEDPVKTFWRFAIKLPLQGHEACWVYSVTGIPPSSAARSPSPSSYTFVVPSALQSMRMMFHSCNGFSVGTDEDAWSGPALWNDVLRSHEQTPFHVMIGGGDQIYNDSIRVDGPLKAWTDVANPRKRRDYPFDEPLRAGCDSFYFQNYVDWYSTEPFKSANSSIPQINIWDDHGMSQCNRLPARSSNGGHRHHRRFWILHRPFHEMCCLSRYRQRIL